MTKEVQMQFSGNYSRKPALYLTKTIKRNIEMKARKKHGHSNAHDYSNITKTDPRIRKHNLLASLALRAEQRRVKRQERKAQKKGE
jgi:hypothetical protein